MNKLSYFQLFSSASSTHAPDVVEESNRIFATHARKHALELDPSIVELQKYVEQPQNEFLRIYISNMLDEANQKSPINIKTPADFFQQLDNALHSYPKYDAQFIAALPFYAVLQPFMANKYGYFLFTNEQVRPYFSRILSVYHQKLAGTESLAYLNDSYGNWLSAEARQYLSLDESVYDPKLPHGGFSSWNDFFTRPFKDINKSRPIAANHTGKDIISPVDGQVWKISKQVQQKAAFAIKGEQYYLTDLLDEAKDSDLLTPFIDGLAVQVVLMPFNYHRWHAPVAGRIKEVKTVPGLFFAAPTPDQDYAASFPFLSHVNTRTIVFIEPQDERVGDIALIFVGLTEVSSCQATVKKGDTVKLGDEIGHFAFGGSTCCMLFEKAKISQLYITDNANLSDGGASPAGGKVSNIVQVRQTIASAL